MRVRISRRFLTWGLGLAFLGTFVALLLFAAGLFINRWVAYGLMIDERLAGQRIQTTAQIHAAPAHLSRGQELTAPQLVSTLRRVGYSETQTESATGWYSVQGDDLVEIHPGPNSYFAGKNALRVEFGGRTIRRIRNLGSQSIMDTAEIEPELLTNIFDSSRAKRRQVRFEDVPQVLVEAVLSAEDKRFFEHPGLDVVRILGAAWADVRGNARLQGASTLTMQVARSFFFSRERTWRRKLAETTMALELERRFTKQQIFELYANEIYLGNRGSFAIHGFAEGSLAYYNKDIRVLSLNEAAFLAGIIRAPNRYSAAERRPERAAEARDRVLTQMVQNRFLTGEQAQEAKDAPLRFVSGGVGDSSAPYFVDMVNDHLLDRFSQADLLSESFRVYTTLDPQLERVAAEAVAIGMANLDEQLARRYERWETQGRAARAQVALVVLDPRTGAIRALIGGRSYGQSQLNRALARRQPGSVFKPFVFATAFTNAAEDVSPILTPATAVLDEPTTFIFNDEEYTPNNYGEKFLGTVSLRDALTYSLNVATVKVAELVGYRRVVEVARRVGIPPNIQPTPALALGAYEMTPLEVAGAYTVFANGGMRAEPMFIDRVVDTRGVTLESNSPLSRPALDPRVAYQVTSVLADVINHGTGASVRARDFTGPAAGKTGTSRDGWFAGFTSNLLCVVWVGFDDNRDLQLSGAASAAPIWTEFMKRATALPAYRDLQDFSRPEDLIELDIDPDTLQFATPDCPVTRKEVFIIGTEPSELCQVHGGRLLTRRPPVSWLSGLFGGGPPKPEESSETAASDQPPVRETPRIAAKPVPDTTLPVASEEEFSKEDEEKKPGIFRRFFGIFGGGRRDEDKP